MDSSMAAIAAALNDAERGEIGDPRQGIHSVRLLAADTEEAHLLAKHLHHLAAAEVRTTILYANGDPDSISVYLYSKEGQQTLLSQVGDALDSPRRQVLEDLVLARGPIPDWLMERIWKAYERRWSSTKIAEAINAQLADEPALIAGMGMRNWSPQKITKAIKNHCAVLNVIKEPA